MTEEATDVLHMIYGHLLKLLSRARLYADAPMHGTSKLVPYFSVLNYCLISRVEKLMVRITALSVNSRLFIGGVEEGVGWRNGVWWERQKV